MSLETGNTTKNCILQIVWVRSGCREQKKFSEKVTLDSILINIEYRDYVGQEDTIITLRSYVYSSKESFLKILSIIKNGGKANNDLSNIMLSTSF